MAELVNKIAETETVLVLSKSEAWFREVFGKMQSLEKKVASPDFDDLRKFSFFFFNSWRLISAKSAVSDFLRLTTAQKLLKSLFREWRSTTRDRLQSLHFHFSPCRHLSRSSRLIGSLWKLGILYSDIPWGELDFACCVLRVWRWYTKIARRLKSIYFDKLLIATDYEALEKYLILRYAQQLVEEHFSNWRISVRILKLGKLAFRHELSVKRKVLMSWSSFMQAAKNKHAIASSFSITWNLRFWFTEWRLVILHSKLAVSHISNFFKSWRNLCLKRGTLFWLAARKSRLSIAFQILKNWQAFLIQRLKKKLVTRKVLNLAKVQLNRTAGRRIFRAWIKCTQIVQWWNSSLRIKVFKSFKIYRLRRQAKNKRKQIALEMYRNETARQVMSAIRARIDHLRTEKLRFAVEREEDRLRTLGRTLAIWRERVNVCKSFRI